MAAASSRSLTRTGAYHGGSTQYGRFSGDIRLLLGIEPSSTPPRIRPSHSGSSSPPAARSRMVNRFGLSTVSLTSGLVTRTPSGWVSDQGAYRSSRSVAWKTLPPTRLGARIPIEITTAAATEMAMRRGRLTVPCRGHWC